MREGRKEEYLLFFYTYANLEKSAGKMSAVIIGVVTQNVFKVFHTLLLLQRKKAAAFPTFKS